MKSLSISCVVDLADDVFYAFTKGCAVTCTPLQVYKMEASLNGTISKLIHMYYSKSEDKVEEIATEEYHVIEEPKIVELSESIPNTIDLSETNNLLREILSVIQSKAVSEPIIVAECLISEKVSEVQETKLEVVEPTPTTQSVEKESTGNTPTHTLTLPDNLKERLGKGFIK